MSFDFVSTGIELPDNWKLTRIGDVAEVNPDTIKKKDEPTEIFYLDISSVSTGQYETPGYMKYIDAPSRAKRRLKPNDFIISTVRPNLRQFAMLEEVGENWVASTGFCVVRAKEARTAWYLYSFITSGLFNEHLVRVADGAAYPSFNPKEIEDAVIPWPADDDLYAINHFAKIINNKVELNRQTNQTLEQIAQAIFKSWFVDFEPTRAKIIAKEQGANPATQELAAQAIISGAITLEQLAEVEQNLETTLQQAIDKKLNQHKQTNPTALNAQQLKTTAALFPNELVESELGSVPEGWSASTLSEHFNVVMGQSPKGDTYNEEGNGMLFFQGRRDFSFRYPEPRVYTTAPNRLAQAGDTLISVRAPVGDRNMAEQECCLGRGVAGIRHKSDARSFTYAFIGHIEKSLGDSGSAGTVFSSINKTELGRIGFVAPSDDLLDVYENNVGLIDQKIEALSNEVKTLEELRDILLPKLLSGELNV